jgi:8-oxo-dGTP pyrophosphatase MutT (NUDIX family)
MKKAYGGVVIDDRGQVLLREPANHHNGYVWTFAKGKPNLGESPEQTALREVLEETGVVARIVMRIPGAFDGTSKSNEYFLMSPIEDTGRFDSETVAVRWASEEEAKLLILRTVKVSGQERDLRVLEAAFAAWRRNSGL